MSKKPHPDDELLASALETDNPAAASKIVSEGVYGNGTRNDQRRRYHSIMAQWYAAKGGKP